MVRRKRIWSEGQLNVVEKYMIGGQRRTAAEVYGRLRKTRTVCNLTIGDVRRFLDKEYVRKGKKRCRIGRKLVTCWGRKPPQEQWRLGPYDGSTGFTKESATKYN